MQVKQLTGIALLVAAGTLTGFFSIPLLGARLFPIQHAINVLAAVRFGPLAAVTVAFAVAVLRNALGMGTVLAFPGGMFGALTAGVLYRMTGRAHFAVLGEVLGTGVLGALGAFPLARLVLGRDVLAYTYIIPFTLSSASGALVATAILRVPALLSSRKEAGK